MPDPTVVVRRPDECAETRAPFPPTDAPTPLLDTFRRTPGAIFIDLRIRKPIEASLVDPSKCLTAGKRPAFDLTVQMSERSA